MNHELLQTLRLHHLPWCAARADGADVTFACARCLKTVRFHGPHLVPTPVMARFFPWRQWHRACRPSVATLKDRLLAPPDAVDAPESHVTEFLRAFYQTLVPWQVRAPRAVDWRPISRPALRGIRYDFLGPLSWSIASALRRQDVLALGPEGYNDLLSAGVDPHFAGVVMDVLQGADTWDLAQALDLRVPDPDDPREQYEEQSGERHGVDASNRPPAALVGAGFRTLPNPWRPLLDVMASGAALAGHEGGVAVVLVPSVPDAAPPLSRTA